MTGSEGIRTVVVAAASRHGSTAEIAARLSQVMSKALSDRWTVRQGELTDLSTFDDADAVVLGSAIYLGHWLRPALQALEYVKDAPVLDLWLFSSGPVSDDVSDNARVITADGMVESGCATEHRVFAGSLDSSLLNWWERPVVKAVHAASGDNRDWVAIEAWAVDIAGQLNHAVAASEPGA